MRIGIYNPSIGICKSGGTEIFLDLVRADDVVNIAKDILRKNST